MTSKSSLRFLLALLAFLLLSLSGCLATPIDTVDDSLIGTWYGESTVRPPISFVPAPEAERGPEVTVPIAITIHEDASVTGNVGDSALVDCVLKSNRSELGRQLNVASDYIVMDGYLDGPIISGDEELQKHFTIPFNIADDRMQGWIMWLQEFRYPAPLLQIELVREGA